ncbi:hypothetical protein R1sor_006232 [Riccia sorocarpa]|uniref:Retrotransposon gag domain-containing protein n=1 Tax=Riccia sorocarpa TaxID=122646 RepID=A0ABD3HNS5_9MARC
MDTNWKDYISSEKGEPIILSESDLSPTIAAELDQEDESNLTADFRQRLAIFEERAIRRNLESRERLQTVLPDTFRIIAPEVIRPQCMIIACWRIYIRGDFTAVYATNLALLAIDTPRILGRPATGDQCVQLILQWEEVTIQLCRFRRGIWEQTVETKKRWGFGHFADWRGDPIGSDAYTYQQNLKQARRATQPATGSTFDSDSEGVKAGTDPPSYPNSDTDAPNFFALIAEGRRNTFNTTPGATTSGQQDFGSGMNNPSQEPPTVTEEGTPDSGTQTGVGWSPNWVPTGGPDWSIPRVSANPVVNPVDPVPTGGTTQENPVQHNPTPGLPQVPTVPQVLPIQRQIPIPQQHQVNPQQVHPQQAQPQVHPHQVHLQPLPAMDPKLRVAYPIYKGKRHEDPDLHISAFETTMLINGESSLHKARLFPATLKHGAFAWFSQLDQYVQQD